MKFTGKPLKVLMLVLLSLTIGACNQLTKKDDTKVEGNVNLEEVTQVEEEVLRDVIKLTVNESRTQDNLSRVKDVMYVDPESEGAVFKILNVTIENISNQQQRINEVNFTLVNEQGVSYGRRTISVSDEVDTFLISTVNPKLSITGDLVFELPKDETGILTLVYSGSDASHESYEAIAKVE